MTSRVVDPAPRAQMRRRTAFYLARETLAQELAEDRRWEIANAAARARPCTSAVPVRCPGCAHWNAPAREKCRECGTPLARPM